MNCSLPKPPEFPLFRFDLVGRAGFDNDRMSAGEGAVDRAEAEMVSAVRVAVDSCDQRPEFIKSGLTEWMLRGCYVLQNAPRAEAGMVAASAGSGLVVPAESKNLI